MKRYLAFAYDGYYASGGKGDFAGDFVSIIDALNTVPQRDYLYILDTACGEWVLYARRIDTWEKIKE